MGFCVKHFIIFELVISDRLLLRNPVLFDQCVSVSVSFDSDAVKRPLHSGVQSKKPLHLALYDREETVPFSHTHIGDAHSVACPESLLPRPHLPVLIYEAMWLF